MYFRRSIGEHIFGEKLASKRSGLGGKGLFGSRYFSESLTRMKDPWGREIFWIGGGTITWTGTENSDHLAVAEGYLSITPLHMDLTNYSLIETVKGWSLEG